MSISKSEAIFYLQSHGYRFVKAPTSYQLPQLRRAASSWRRQIEAGLTPTKRFARGHQETPEHPLAGISGKGGNLSDHIGRRRGTRSLSLNTFRKFIKSVLRKFPNKHSFRMIAIVKDSIFEFTYHEEDTDNDLVYPGYITRRELARAIESNDNMAQFFSDVFGSEQVIYMALFRDGY